MSFPEGEMKRCGRCGAKPVIELRRHNVAFCKDCFIHYFRQQVVRAIHDEKMFTPGERILVAISGGKDSLALWEVLMHLGYQTTGLHIELNTDPAYSANSSAKSRAFAEQYKAPIIVVNLREQYGLDVGEVIAQSRRVPCSGCGIIKRHVFMDVARHEGFPVLATGHNLDDEAARLFGNVLHWQVEYLAKSAPNLSDEDDKFVRKAKPFYRLSEKETATYAFLQGIDYVVEECPQSENATSLVYKDILNRLENASPGSKQQFYFGFLRNRERFRDGVQQMEMRVCERCGHPTPTPICAFCRLQEEIKRASQPKTLPAKRAKELPVVA
jgi:uncharacterized protein (TIGR00269 family)